MPSDGCVPQTGIFSKTKTHIIIPEKYEVCSSYFARKIITGNFKSSLTILKDATHFFSFEKSEKMLGLILEKI